MKKCSKCDAWKAREEYHRKRGNRDRLNTWCKMCVRSYDQCYREQNREKKAEQGRRYYRQNREKILGRNRQYREQNREKLAELQRQYYYQNREKLAEWDRQYWEQNREEILERNRQYYRQNREKLAEYQRQYQKQNPHKFLEYAQDRRARKANASGSFTRKQWLELCGLHDNRCLCCGESKELHADHVAPLSRGGSNDIGNIQPLCKSCNSSKGTKTIDYRSKLPAEERAS